MRRRLQEAGPEGAAGQTDDTLPTYGIGQATRSSSRQRAVSASLPSLAPIHELAQGEPDALAGHHRTVLVERLEGVFEGSYYNTTVEPNEPRETCFGQFELAGETE